MNEPKWWKKDDPGPDRRWKGHENSLPVPNLSTCMFHILLNMLDFYAPPKGDCLLVAENPDIIPYLQPYYPNLNFFTYGYSGFHGKDFEQDFNILFTPSRTYDVVVCQCCLEHVCRPGNFLENMNNLCKVGGYSITLTHGPQCPLHRVPVDCLRFLKDFWIDITKYIPMQLVAYYDDEQEDCTKTLHCGATYQKLK